MIPDSVKQTWREWRKSMKQAQNGIPGGKEVGDGVEMAGWGVEEAEKHNKAEASMCSRLPALSIIMPWRRHERRQIKLTNV